MQKYDFLYQSHELDDKHIKSIYEDSYESATEAFIHWVHQNGFIGYFGETTVLGNPSNRKHVQYTEDLSKPCLNIYVLEYTLLNYHHGDHIPTEQHKIQLYKSDEIQEFIMKIREIQQQENVKNLRTYKGTLTSFDYKELNL